jgi:ferredoxin/flavodoxin
MISEIFYFSGTGNSLATARVINEKSVEKGGIIPIPNAKSVTNADRAGFVFPVYCHKIPEIVERFILKMEFTSSPYIYAVATNNGEPGQSLFDVHKLLAKKGQSLSLGISIEMPGNATVTPPDIELKRLLAMERKVAEMAELIKVRKRGIIEGNNSLIEHIKNRIGTPLKLSYVFSPKRYKISDNCIGCGTCEKVCPVNNIHLVNHKPVWDNKCATCLACFHWCPKEAIYDNRYIKNRRKYHHPDIKLNDMLLRK